MKKLCHFDRREGLRTPRMDAILHKLGIGPQSHCTLEMMDVAFGGTWKTLEDDIIALGTWTLASGGLGRHFLCP
jgi:hypothetical protein